MLKKWNSNLHCAGYNKHRSYSTFPSNQYFASQRQYDHYLNMQQYLYNQRDSDKRHYAQPLETITDSARGNWDPREDQQPFRPNPNGVGDHTSTLRRLLIGANPTPTFLGVTFDRTLFFFSKHVSSLKAKFFPRLKALRCISASSWAPLRYPSLFCIKLFSGPFSLMPLPDGFLS